MKKWTLVDQAQMPGGETISLHEHDGSYYIRLDGAELMSTRRHASEEKIAELACAQLGRVRGARVLVGGLGCGFSLRTALAAVGADATVVVAELSPAVIAWNRNPAFPLAAAELADPRVEVVQQDVGETIRGAKAGFNSIILDVDNGPAALSSASNRRLYDYSGLRHIHAALRPGGCVAFWSVAGDPAFELLMARAGFTVAVQRCRERPSSGGRHTIFLGRVK